MELVCWPGFRGTGGGEDGRGFDFVASFAGGGGGGSGTAEGTGFLVKEGFFCGSGSGFCCCPCCRGGSSLCLAAGGVTGKIFARRDFPSLGNLKVPFSMASEMAIGSFFGPNQS